MNWIYIIGLIILVLGCGYWLFFGEEL